MNMDSSLLYNMHAHHSPFFFGSSLNLSSSPISISPLTTTSSSLPNDTDRYLYLTRHQNQHHGRDNIPLFPPPGLSLHHYGNEPDPKTGLFTSTTVDAAHLTTSTLYPGLNINSTDAITQAHLDRTSTTTTSMSGTYATIDPTVAGPPDTSYLAREDPDQRQLQWLYDSINALLPTVGDDALALQDAVESPVALGDDVFDVEACIDQMASGFVNIKDVNSYVAESDSAKIAAAFHLAATSEDEGEYSIAVIVDENEVEDDSLPLLLPSPPSDINYALTGRRRHEDDISEVLPFDLDSTPQCYEQDYSQKFHPDEQCGGDNILPKHPRYDDIPSPIPSTKRRRSSTTGSLSSFSRSSSPATSTTSSTDTLLSVGPPHPRESSNDADVESIGDSEDDDEYVPDPSRPAHFVKKGRNVERACNHCKRSHLRCDEARPCRRCVSAGKADCRDVQHKPRGRPRVVRK